MVSKEEHTRYAFLTLQTYLDELVYNGSLTDDDANEIEDAINYLRDLLEVK